MRKLVIALAISTMTFAASTLYFWLAWRSERSKVASSPRPTVAAPAAVHPATNAAPTNAAPTNTGSSNPAQPPELTEEEQKARIRASLVAAIPNMRATLEDPDKRAATMSDIRKNNERSMPHLARNLDLTEDEYARLMNMLVELEMRALEARYQCALAANCDVMASGRPVYQANRRELVDFLGAEKAQQFDNYRDDSREREIVADWRGDLPDSLRLSDAQTEKLVEVLGDERRRIAKEWEQRGAGENGMSNQYGSIQFPSTAQGAEQRIAEASEYQRRQRERAAQVLTAGQLEAFTERQKEALDLARGAWEYEEQSANNTTN
jgi:hypothetical protein